MRVQRPSLTTTTGRHPAGSGSGGVPMLLWELPLGAAFLEAVAVRELWRGPHGQARHASGTSLEAAYACGKDWRFSMSQMWEERGEEGKMAPATCFQLHSHYHSICLQLAHIFIDAIIHSYLHSRLHFCLPCPLPAHRSHLSTTHCAHTHPE